jgi:ankyrin repeat protein
MDVENEHGRTALREAAEHGQTAVVQKLLEAGTAAVHMLALLMRGAAQPYTWQPTKAMLQSCSYCWLLKQQLTWFLPTAAQPCTRQPTEATQQ